MYVRVFHDLWESSLMAEDVPVRWLFVTMLQMADKARSGIIDVPLFILARHAGMSEADTRKALATLAAPDRQSRSEKDGGRRIVPIRPDVERGWEIVNWEEYAAQFRADDRRRQVKEAVARHKERSRHTATESSVINANPEVINLHEGREGKSSLLPPSSLFPEVIPSPNTVPSSKALRHRFVSPSKKEISDYAISKGWTAKDWNTTEFFEFYASKGWVVGKSPMKDWKMAAQRAHREGWTLKKSGNGRVLKTSDAIEREQEAEQIRSNREALSRRHNDGENFERLVAKGLEAKAKAAREKK